MAVAISTATRQLGTFVVNHLKAEVPAGRVIPLVRSPDVVRRHRAT